jgi:hypothetical protein
MNTATALFAWVRGAAVLGQDRNQEAQENEELIGPQNEPGQVPHDEHSSFRASGLSHV